jgi:hypothetical protein
MASSEVDVGAVNVEVCEEGMAAAGPEVEVTEGAKGEPSRQAAETRTKALNMSVTVRI